MSEPNTSFEPKLVFWTKLLAIFTFLLAITSAISNVFTWVDASEKRSTADLTADLLRPIMHVEQFNIVLGKDVKTGNPLVAFNVVERNIGGTRAVGTEGWVSIKYHQDDIPDNVDFSRPGGKVVLAPAIIAPNASLPVEPVSVSFEDVKRTISGAGSIVLWGVTTYHSVYKPKDTIPMSFCVVIKIDEAARLQDAIADTPQSEIARLAIRTSPARSDCNRNP